MSIKINLSVPKLLWGRERATLPLHAAIRSMCLESGSEGERDRVIAVTLGKLTELVLEHIDDQKVKQEFLSSILPEDAKIVNL